MKTFTITVNGQAYNVTVEEGAQTSAPISAPVAQAPVAPAPVAPAAPATPAPSAGATGANVVKAPMPGKVLAVKVQPGQTVKSGDVVIVMEAMKMEHEIVTTFDGVVATTVSVGQSVEPDEVLVSLN